MLLRFTKMHGAGNDYVYVNGFSDTLPDDPQRVARFVSDRHKGIGSDGLILVCPSDVADAEMRMFNVDGSESEMCGNGFRCVAKMLCDEGIVRGDEMHIATGAGILPATVTRVDGLVESVKVQMGRPELDAERIPTLLSADPATGQVVNAGLDVAGHTIRVTCVSMGNPHCVVFLDDLPQSPKDEEQLDRVVHELGPQIETHPMFPARVNVEFVAIESRRRVRQRTWERGSGETQACGSGASAVCVAGVLTGRTETQITCVLLGGTLELDWPAPSASVALTGPATKVYEGVIEI